ncbi:hypothetical protein D3C87_713450 [compost metagenome]
MIRSPASLWTSYTLVLSNNRMLGSCFTLSSKIISNITALPSGLRYTFSTNISSITPPSRLQRLLLPIWEVAPSIHNLTSLEAFPPSTDRSCTNTTRKPCLAAVIAAHTPDIPPPTTTKSAVTTSFFNVLEVPPLL